MVFGFQIFRLCMRFKIILLESDKIRILQRCQNSTFPHIVARQQGSRMYGSPHRQRNSGMTLRGNDHFPVKGRMIRHGGSRGDGIHLKRVGCNNYRFGFWF